MATPKSQQIGIWIIAIVMVIGTMGSFLAMIFSTQNKATDQSALQKANTEYQALVTARNAKVAVQAKELSTKYYAEFSKYSSNPSAFVADSIKNLTKKDLSFGDGAEVKTGTKYSAYYIGWNPKGIIFDQSIKDGALVEPIAGGSLIAGWEEGVIGMKFGGVRELAIPSAKAYGATGSGENIPPNTPIKFIVMIIPEVSEIPQVTVPQILLDYYQSQSANS